MVEEDQSPLGGSLELPGGDQPERPSYKSPTGHGHRKKVIIGLAVLVVLAGLGYGGWKIMQKDTKPSAATSQQPSPASQQTEAKTSDVPETTELKTFESIDLGVELAHPNTWTANETAGGIRITSPDFSYHTTDKGTISGNFRVYIRKGARETDSKYIGRGVAITASEKLTYDQPTSTQRKDTLVSIFGLDTPNNFGYFLVAGNFQLNKGDTLGPDYGKEPETFIVTGGYSSSVLTDDLATNKVPLDSYRQTNAYKQAIAIIKSLKLE